jgi:hypothetical protein
LDFFSDTLALPSVIATIMMRPTSPLFSAFNPTLTAFKEKPQSYPDYRYPGTIPQLKRSALFSVLTVLRPWAKGEPPPHGSFSRRFRAIAMDLDGGSRTSA